MTSSPPPIALRLENDELRLDLTTDLYGRNALTDKVTGEVYEAAGFGVVRIYDSTEDRVWVQTLSPSPANVFQVEQGDDGAVIHIAMGGEGSGSAMGEWQYGLAFDVSFRLVGNTLEIEIPGASLYEHLSERFRIKSIEILPRLGATPKGSPGFLFIPSHAGGVYYFDRNHPKANPDFATTGKIDINTEPGLQSLWGQPPDAPAEYGSLVYGIQAAWEDQLLFPVYGTIRDGAGLGGLCVGGAFDTQLLASRDQGAEHRAAIYPRWVYRHFWHSKVDPESRKIRLVALRGEDASYSGLANLCRDFIVHDMGARTLKQRCAESEALAWFKDSLRATVMFGMLKRVDRVSICRVFQSFDDQRETVPWLREAGFDKVSYIFVGANMMGHDGGHPTIFPIEYQHGGERKFQTLIDTVREHGYRCGVHANYKDVYYLSPDWDPAYVQVNEFGQLRFHGAWMAGYSFQGLPHEMWRRFARRDLPRLRDMGMYGFNYFDAVGSVMEETFPPGQAITRREYCEGLLTYLREGEEIFGSVGTETLIAPLIGVSVSVGHCYVGHGGKSVTDGRNGYSTSGLLDHYVPAQMMILHGLVLYTGGPEVAGRVETYFNEKPTREKIAQVKQLHDESQAWRGELDFAFFTRHDEIADGITRSEFRDDDKTWVIWVNKGEEDYDADGVTIPAQGHRVLGPTVA